MTTETGPSEGTSFKVDSEVLRLLSLPALQVGEKSLGVASRECISVLKKAAVIRLDAGMILKALEPALQYMSDEAAEKFSELHRQLYSPTSRLMLANAANKASEAEAIAWQCIQAEHGFDAVRGGRPAFRVDNETIVMIVESDATVSVAAEPWHEAGQDAPADDLTTRANAVAKGTEVTAQPVAAETSEQKTAPIAAIVPNERSDSAKIPDEEDILRNPRAALGVLLATQQPGAVVKEKKAA